MADEQDGHYTVRLRGTNLDQLSNQNREDIIAAVMQYTHGPPVTVHGFMVGSEAPVMAVFVRHRRFYLAVTATEITLIYRMRDLDNLLIAHLLESDQVIRLD